MTSYIKTLSELDQNILNNLLIIHLNAFKKFNFRPLNYKDFVDFFNSEYKIFYHELDNKIVGFAVVHYNLDFTEIITIAVDNHYQRKKIGNSLMKYIISCDRIDNSLYIEVAKNNYTAIKFYNKYGFSVFSKRKNYYLVHSGKDKGTRIDALVMKLTL